MVYDTPLLELWRCYLLLVELKLGSMFSTVQRRFHDRDESHGLNGAKFEMNSGSARSDILFAYARFRGGMKRYWHALHALYVAPNTS